MIPWESAEDGLIQGGTSVWLLTHSKRKQNPVIVDCYEYAGVVLGGSCESASFRFLDSELYSQTGGAFIYLRLIVALTKSC